MTGCPPEDDLVRMVEGALADASLSALEAHVDRCEHCAAVIAGLGAMGRAAGPRVVGRYQLDRRIAAGGMGEVWAAWDPQLRRELAVKLVRPDRADDGSERERLLREARALARLTHPNVLAVHDVGEVDGEVFLATELVAGDTLANRGGASADWRQLLRYYIQAARGLAAAHAAGLVHRDVKPSNLLLGADGRVRVADFGLAVRSQTPSPLAPTETPSESGRDPQITAAGMVVGTPAYMAPEQRAGYPPDARADQYALCVALGEAIAGRRPPMMRSGAELIAWVADRRNREPALDTLCGVLVLGMATEPDDRFPDMTALADALEAIISESSATATMLRELPPPAVPVVPRRRSRAPLVAAAAVVLAGASGIAIYLATRPASAPAVAPAPPPVATTTPVPVVKQPVDIPAAPPDAPPAQVPKRIMPPTTPTPAPPAPAVGFDFNAIHKAGQVAANHRNIKACNAAVARIPASVPPSSVFAMDITRATCAMLAGDCAGGRTWAVAAAKAEDIGAADEWADRWALDYCPITGDLGTRLDRMQAQIGMHGDHVEWCDALMPFATAALGELTSNGDVGHRALEASVLEGLARCYGLVNQCDKARNLWQNAIALYDGAQYREPNVPNCDVGHAKKISAPVIVAPAVAAKAGPDPTLVVITTPEIQNWLTATQNAVDHRDAGACRAQLASQPTSGASEPRVLTAHAICEMVSDRCDAGLRDLGALMTRQAIPANQLKTIVDPFGDAYCPIGTDPPTRLRRLHAQVRTASGARCTGYLRAARDAAAAATTADDRRTAGSVLNDIARCYGEQPAGCIQARQVMSEAHAVDARYDVDGLQTDCR